MAYLIFFKTVLYGLACLSLGLLIMRWLFSAQFQRSATLTQWTFAFLLGQGTLAYVWLFLVLAGWFYPVVVAFLTIGLILGGAPLLYTGSSALLESLRSLWRELRAESWVWQSIAVVEAFFCLYFVTTLGAGLTGDSMAFYMAVPKLAAASHRLMLPPGTEQIASFGLQGELHYAALMSLGNGDAARLFDWPTLLAGAVMLLAICRKVGAGRRGQLIALAMFLTSFAVLHFTGQGKVDRFALGLALAAIYWAMQMGFSALTGYLTGIAIVAKIAYLPFFLPTVLFLALWRQLLVGEPNKQPNLSIRLILGALRGGRLLFPFGVGFFAALLPFLLKLLYLPYLLQDQSKVDAAMSFGARFLAWATPFSQIIVFLFRFPFDVTFMLYESVSPLILAFIPLVLLLPRQQLAKLTPLWAVTLAAVGSTVIWMSLFPIFTHPLSIYYGRELRYFLPSVFLFIPLAARAAEYATREHENRSMLLNVAIISSVLLTLVTTALYYTDYRVFFPRNAYGYLTRQLSDCDLPHEPNYCAVMQELNRIAPPGARILEYTGNKYWLRTDLIECSENLVNVPTFEQQDDLWAWVHRNGFDYLIVAESDPVLSGLIASPSPKWVDPVLVLQDGPISIYSLNYEISAAEPEKACQQTAPGVWRIADRKADAH